MKVQKLPVAELKIHAVAMNIKAWQNHNCEITVC